MLSKTSKYSIRAALHLALGSSETCYLKTKELSEALKISTPMLSKVLQQLTKRKIITSKKGRHGGFFMSQQQKSNTIMNLVQETEASDSLLPKCFFGRQTCPGTECCPYASIVSPIRSNIKALYSNDSIETTARKIFLLT
jgi:Rrf2 family protein